MFYFKHNKKTRVVVSVVAILIVVVMVLSMIVSVAFAQELSAKESVSVLDVPLPSLIPEDVLEQYGRQVLPAGVYLEGHSLEGLTAEEASAYVSDYAAAIAARPVTLAAEGREFCYDAAGLAMQWQNPGAAACLEELVLSGSLKERICRSRRQLQEPCNLCLDFSFNEDILRQQVQAVADAYFKPAVNASVYLDENHQFVIVPGESGYRYDSAAIQEELIAAVKCCESTEPVRYELPQTITEPEYGEASFAFSAEPLGSYTTSNLGAANRVNNIRLSAANMNGHLFYPGETASANTMFGEISEANGYTWAPGYQSGKQVPALGGGICQTTSTLYNAVLRADLDTDRISRRGHSMLVTYVPPSMDATVSNAIDFTFVNTLDCPIYIESYVSGDTVTVNIWGQDKRPENRSIDFTYEVLSVEWPAVLYERPVSDELCTYGPVDVSLKIFSEVTPHPAVHSRSYKQVFTDGVLTEQILLNEDSYGSMIGRAWHASDCDYYAVHQPSDSPDAVYPYLHETITTTVVHLDGVPWMTVPGHY